MRFSPTFALCLATVLACSQAFADVTPEAKKEISEMQRELRTVSSMVRKKDVDGAKAIIEKVETRLEELNIADDERDRTVIALRRSLATAKNAIPVSFMSEVAPIIKDKCLQCHDENRTSGRLRLDSYAAMGQGGQSGPLLLPRNPQRSHIMARIMAEGQQRMPRGGDKLSNDEISIIGRWIAGGAQFDGEDVRASIATVGMAPPKPKPKVDVVMADGSESISFKDDIAPWMVNVCMGCHNERRSSGGFQLTTFETLLQGGDTGSTVVPGEPDNSYIVDLVLRQDPIKMPAGNQTRIKRSQAQALETWIKEGAHFDGKDPKATLRSMVPTVEELEAMKLASMPDSAFAERRIEQADNMWRRVAPREEPTSVTSKHLYVYGNAPQSRLDQISEWGEAQVASLTSEFALPDGEQPWRGRLIVFVSKTRFDYEEFNTVLLNRRTPRSISGHVRITPSFDDAYIAFHDVGDTDSADAFNTQQLLSSLIAQAYLAREGTNLPDWLLQGFGIMESGAGADSPYMRQLPLKAGEALRTVSGPATIFDNGTFSPDEVGAVGYMVTRFLRNNGGLQKLAQLTTQLKTARSPGRAIEATYGRSAEALGAAFLQSGG